MNVAMLTALAKLAFEYGPELAAKIRNAVKQFGSPMDERRFLMAMEILHKDPNSYFGYLPEVPHDFSADPTEAAYMTLDEATANVVVGYPFVVKMADGTFHVWPVVGPFPGEVVYPVP